MSEVYAWVRNITCYLILVTVCMNLLPSKKYEKYIKLFTSMILILLVLKPLTGSLRLEDKMAYYFNEISFQNQSEDLKKELLGVEAQRLQSMILQYEEAVEMDVERMLEDSGLYPVKTEVNIEDDRDKEMFGKVTLIRMVVSGEERAAELVEETEDRAIRPVEEIQIDVEGKEGNEGAQLRRTADGESEDWEREAHRADLETMYTLQRKIAQYYDLEESYVEVQLENRKR